VKPAGILGNKGGMSDIKIEELETNSKIKNTRDLYRCISDLKKGY
jgi:hypothetical protein